MQNSNANKQLESRILTKYPDYSVDINAKVINITKNKEVKILKKDDAQGLARVKLYKDGVSYKETIQDLMLSAYTEEEIFGDGTDVFGLNTNKPKETGLTGLDKEVWIDGELIAINKKLVFNYLYYLPLSLWKNPCMPYMTEEQQDEYNNQKHRYDHRDTFRYI